MNHGRYMHNMILIIEKSTSSSTPHNGEPTPSLLVIMVIQTNFDEVHLVVAVAPQVVRVLIFFLPDLY